MTDARPKRVFLSALAAYLAVVLLVLAASVGAAPSLPVVLAVILAAVVLGPAYAWLTRDRARSGLLVFALCCLGIPLAINLVQILVLPTPDYVNEPLSAQHLRNDVGLACVAGYLLAMLTGAIYAVRARKWGGLFVTGSSLLILVGIALNFAANLSPG